MRRGVLAVLTAIVAAVPATAWAADPPFAGWPALLPALAPGFTPNTFDVCRDGAPSCVTETIAEMQRRLASLDEACDHRALFLRNYLTVTQHYAQLPAGYLEDPRFFAQEDAVFAKLYFDAFDAYEQGRLQDVPPAWRMAFDTATRKEAEGAGDLMLGINAHVQRDMPFMLAGLGLVAPDGRSRKTDHDRFNAALNASYDEVIRRAIAMDDPRLRMYDVPGPADETALFNIVASWREGVWRNAERLLRARTPQERAQVAASIEEQAAFSARIIKANFDYRPPISSVEPRTAHCRSRPADPGPGSPPADLRPGDFVRADMGPLRVRVRLR